MGARPTIKFVRPHLILTILNNCGEIHSLTSKYYGKQSFKMNKNNNVTKCEITMQPTSYIVELKLFNRGIRANIEVPGGVQMLTKICREKIQNSSSQEQNTQEMQIFTLIFLCIAKILNYRFHDHQAILWPGMGSNFHITIYREMYFYNYISTIRTVCAKHIETLVKMTSQNALQACLQ